MSPPKPEQPQGEALGAARGDLPFPLKAQTSRNGVRLWPDAGQGDSSALSSAPLGTYTVGASGGKASPEHPPEASAGHREQLLGPEPQLLTVSKVQT